MYKTCGVLQEIIQLRADSNTCKRVFILLLLKEFLFSWCFPMLIHGLNIQLILQTFSSW